MKTFAQLLDRLVLTPSRNAKLQLLRDYFATTPDPDRGIALAALTGRLDIASVKPAMLRGLMAERMDDTLFRLSYDYVGDLAETIALVWDPQPTDATQDNEPASLSTIVESLQMAGKTQAMSILTGWLDRLDASGRYALLKLLTGGLRIGVSARLAKLALADYGKIDVTSIEELWHGQEVPFTALFAWLSGKSPKPTQTAAAPFRPVMLANALVEADREKLDAALYAAEWKWDGIRLQATSEAGVKRLYSRTGDDVGRAFPDLLEAMDFEGSIDGELLVAKPGSESVLEVGSFGDLQQRLNRKTVSKKLLASHPVFLRAYDLLEEGGENLRHLPFLERRKRLEKFVSQLESSRFDLSPMIDFGTWDQLAEQRANPPHVAIEGVMIKQWDSVYQPGRPKGPWFKWKRDPMLIDAVLMYAQRGHGKRSSYYSDYTFGVWTEDGALVPVGKAYFGFTDDELKQIDKYVRENTVDRFGPVRSVIARPDFGLVFEVAFEGLNRSKRHKSGVAMRFPRISRLRWDKPPGEADTLNSLEKLIS
ncbi:MAG: cisplatin damage response ATP-dependent DNA ligase [Rhizobiaceae bacterium]|nr:cisplatin damage response ATP-dependent DNA ligase [Hyphomicrobiales bacterium]NRB30488.1 cisplatin damage response ATP-dependent DNA ligase [Rhizobiaceae bacterium]